MRVLIATVTAGSGHLQAAAALEEAWRSLRPRDTVQKLDVLDFTPKLYRTFYVESYLKIIEHAPELWAHVFKKTDNPELVRKLTRGRRMLAQITTAKFARRIQEWAPEVVLCTHYLPLEIMGRVVRENGTNDSTFIVSTVTDFEAHALWMEASVDLYCVAAEETKARLVARGALANNVAVTGIPISSRFGARLKPSALRRQMGLRDDLHTLLVLSGGFGLGPVAEILSELNKLSDPVQILVVCGRNDELRRELAMFDQRQPTRLFGFVQNMQELMAVADLVITKPGGLTSSEALAMGKPLFILNPIPGQEAANSDFLLQNGAAMKANRMEDLPFRIEKLLGSARLAETAAAAKRLGRPHAAADVCREVLRRVAETNAAKLKWPSTYTQAPEKPQVPKSKRASHGVPPLGGKA
jgi:processive 1,2-diacylglycerol beta-glucosyltransferase